jgi:hypothetical protein
MRLVLVALLALTMGCASFTVVAKVDKETIALNKLSVARKGPYKALVSVPTEHGRVTIAVEGNDEAMSSNLAFTGGIIGMIVGGPPGAAAGSAAGMAAEIFDEAMKEEVTE